MATMRILNPTARRPIVARQLTPFAAISRRVALLHNHSPHFDRLAAALPEALKPALQAETIDTYVKERYSSGASPDILQALRSGYELVITGLAA
jgi:hypothetical protein